MKDTFNTLEPRIEEITKKAPSDAIGQICQLLFDAVAHYNWVGIYYMNDARQMLEIGPYSGAETDHTEIPYGRGICGQVAQSGATFLVPDVHEQSNYLSCSIETKAEIVVPIYKNEILVAQLDIDSHYKNPFGAEDEAFLDIVCKHLAKLM